MRTQKTPLLRIAAAMLILAAGSGLWPRSGHEALAKAKDRTPVKTQEAKASPFPAEDLAQLAQEIAQDHGVEAQAAWHILRQAQALPAVRQLIRPAATARSKNWAAYRARFIEPIRLQAGDRFWQANERWLQEAESRFGVPAHIIMGIIGVETMYGKNTGEFRVLDTLTTLTFHIPTEGRDRRAFFRDELKAFVAWSIKDGFAATRIRGSYAGALGMPQFMPSSVARYGFDMSGDGHIDLHHQVADVIGSVANYLAMSGWVKGLPTHLQLIPPPPGAQRQTLLGPDILPSWTRAQMTASGTQFLPSPQLDALPEDAPLALVELNNGEGAEPTYVGGTRNFYAVTRYNRSSYYALAVIELGEALLQRRPSRP